MTTTPTSDLTDPKLLLSQAEAYEAKGNALLAEAQAKQVEGKSCIDVARKMRELARAMGVSVGDAVIIQESVVVKLEKPKPLSRIDELRGLLKKHGPMTRSEIEKHTDMPQGSLNANLTRNNFVKDSEGRWTAEMSKKKG